jgi:hypothetical protein
MLLVVGKHYVDSGWCSKELQYFAEFFGREGFEKRLFIVAMSEEAIKRAQESAKGVWPQLVGNDQVWVKMYEDNDPDQPIKPKADNTMGFRSEFFDRVKRFVDPLITEIEADYRATSDAVAVPAPQSGVVRPGTAMVIAIGPATTQDTELQERAETLRAILAEEGAECFSIGTELFSDYDLQDPESSKPLRIALERADLLVVPYREVPPMLPGVIAGGHIGILDREWQALNKSRSVIWFKPHDLPVPEGVTVKEHHLQVLRSLVPLCDTQQAVLSLIFGQKKGAIVTLRVEEDEDRRNALHEALCEQIYALWDKIRQNETLVPTLKCLPLYFDNFDKDAAGFVLLFPCRTQSAKALDAKMLEIEDALGDSFRGQGRVAVVLGDNADETEAKTGARRWGIFKCRQVDSKIPPNLDMMGENKLEAFLTVLLNRHRKKLQ